MHKFNGFDWTELADAFGVERPPEEDEDFDDHMLAEKTREHMLDNLADQEDTAAKAKVTREFLRVLAREETKSGGYYTPAWRGLLRLKEDYGGNLTLLKLTAAVLEHMWT